MEPRLSLITLGVDDMARARRFYEALGFKASPASNDNVTFFQMNGIALGLLGRKQLAEDAHLAGTQAGFPAITLAHNLRSEAEVDACHGAFVAAGGRNLKTPQKVFWGGYSGYAADPDGHIWEFAFNPFFPLDDAGNLELPR